jgi:AcrR family transcriptional regulator
MPLQRDGYHHGDLRNALVASAVRLIETSGTSSFSLREAAREVGVSANAAYRHFDGKSALMTAVAAFGFRQLATQMVGAMASAAGSDRSDRGRCSIVQETGITPRDSAGGAPLLDDPIRGAPVRALVEHRPSRWSEQRSPSS